MDWILVQFLLNCFQEHATEPYWLLVNIGSGNGLVPSGNKPLPDPMLTQIYRKVSNISGTKCQNLNDSRLAVVYAQSTEAKC